jgi:hypothetical protein
MKVSCTFIGGWLLACCCVTFCHAQTDKAQNGGFRELLEIAGVGPDKIAALSPTEFSDADWETLAQIVRRLQQHNEVDLARWTLPKQNSFSSQLFGELFEVDGIVGQVESLAIPAAIAERLELKQLYRCRVKVNDSQELTVLALKIPRRWDATQPLAEPVSFLGVLLQAGEDPLLLATRLRWFPTSGVPSGQLLLAQHGMDVSLWEEIVQRTPFVSPDKGQESLAFYSCLAALQQVPATELAALTIDNISRVASAGDSPSTKITQQIAVAVNEQAARGLSSVAPLFFKPEKEVGELLRIEGTVRRAVRIAVDDDTFLATDQSIREYFELEVFTDDSQNLPLVCCVTRLPADFPTGDAIREEVRLDGVFFKMWQYRSRKIVETAGETTTQQQSYTPVILGATVTWLQQASAEPSWWGLTVGGAIFAAMMFGLLRMVFTFRQERRTRLPDKPPNFSGMG